jgi:hypothetical protein
VTALLDRMCEAAPTGTISGSLLEAVVIQPVAEVLMGQLEGGSGYGGAARLLARLLDACRVAIVDTTAAATAPEGEHVSCRGATVPVRSDVLVRLLMEGAEGQGEGGEGTSMGQMQLLVAMVLAGATSLDGLAAHALSMCFQEGFSIMSLENELAAAADSFPALVGAWRSAAGRMKPCAVSAAAAVILQVACCSGGLSRLSGVGKRRGWDGLVLVCLGGALLWRCPHCAALLTRSVQEFGGMDAAGSSQLDVRQLLALCLEGAAAVAAGADEGVSGSAAGMNGATPLATHAAAVELLLPAAEALCRHWAPPGAASRDACHQTLVATFALALPALFCDSGSSGSFHELQQAALQSWLRLVRAPPRSPPGNAIYGHNMPRAPLAPALVRHLVVHYSLLTGLSGSSPVVTADALATAAAASHGGRAAVHVLMMCSALDGSGGLAAAWSALASELPGLPVLLACLGGRAPDPATVAASVAAADANAGELPPAAALLVALLLHVQEPEIMAGCTGIAAALALECALQGGAHTGAPLALLVLHHADVLAAEGGAEAGGQHWTTALWVLAAMPRGGAGVAHAESALLYLLAHLPLESADDLAAGLFVEWAPARATPVTIATDASALAAARCLLAALLPHVQSACRAGSREVIAARDAVARLWLDHLNKQEPVLLPGGAADPSEGDGVGDTHSDLVSDAMLLLASLYMPQEQPALADPDLAGFHHACELFDLLAPDSGTATGGAADPTDGDDDSSDGGGAEATYVTGVVAPVATPAPAPAVGTAPETVAAFARCAAHQLRTAGVHAHVHTCAFARCDALLRLLVVCSVAAGDVLTASTWERLLRVLCEFLNRVTAAAEKKAEVLCASVVTLAESVTGAPAGMDVPFALAFLSRLSGQPGLLSPVALDAFDDGVAAVLPAGVTGAAMDLLISLRAAADADASRFGGLAAEQLHKLECTVLRLVFAAGVSLCATATRGGCAALQTRVLGHRPLFWAVAARSALAKPSGCGVLSTAVTEFDGWSQELGVQVFDALMALLACDEAPLALRALALACAVQEPLLSRTAFVVGDEGYDLCSFYLLRSC